MKEQHMRLKAVILVLFYLLVRMVGDFYYWRFVPEWNSYALEAGFVLVAYGVFRKRIKLWKKISIQEFLGIAGALVGGFAIYHAAAWISVPIPFDLSAKETIFLLLVVAPLLEEAIFRLALWEALAELVPNPWFITSVTTLLFSFGHFSAYFYVPEEYKNFLLYQTGYVIFLGIAASIARIRSNTFLAPMLVHFGFNLGFLLGSKF